MKTLNKIHKTTKQEQRLAIASYEAFASALQMLRTESAEIEIEGTKERIRIPSSAIKLLKEILNIMSQGNQISLIPVAAEVTTQKAAAILGVSGQHLEKLIEEGELNFTKTGRHRRIRLVDIMNYQEEMKERHKKHLIEIMESDEELGLYDS